jgi:hypothetical protein
MLHGGATVHYVDINSTNATPPFTDWSTAATNIQDAVDAATAGDTVLVSNGVYQTGATFVSGLDGTSNRVAVSKALTLQSVNGPQFTIIEGYQVPGTTNDTSAVRCVYLANGAALIGFTLTNGATVASSGGYGGGIWFETALASNCVVVGNAAGYNAGGAIAHGRATLVNCTLARNRARLAGGGAQGCVLVGCTLVGNFAGNTGGGSISGVLTNCAVIGNSAVSDGGGSYGEKLVNCTVAGNAAFGKNATNTAAGGVGNSSLCANCVVYFNTAPVWSNYYDSPMSYSCTTPAAIGPDNITNAPVFVDLANGDLHLQSNSPCINAGRNSYITFSTDLDGNPRIVGGTVDMGAYEFQFPTSVISYAWLQQYGFPTDGSADYADPDHDGMNNWQEWIAGTNPTNALSVLMMLAPSNAVSGIAVPWQSVSGITYFLQRSTNLAVQPAFTSVQSNLVGQAGTTVFMDTKAIGGGPFFYRVGVQQ